MKRICLVILGLIIALGAACSKNTDKKGIDFSIQVLPDVLTDFLYVKMNYNYKLADNFAGLPKGYRAFVHFWRVKNREMLIQDDHEVEKDPSTWQKGQIVQYSRTLFIPKFLDEFDIDFKGYEEVKLTIGLYEPAKPDDKIILFSKVFNVQPESAIAPEKIYDEGWYSPETNARIQNPEESHWRWTSKKAVCVIVNPQRDCTLIIRGKKKLPEQSVVFKINGNLLEDVKTDTLNFSREYTITPQMMGKEQEFSLTLETDKPFVPAQMESGSKDNRELGLQIYFLYFRSKI